MTEYLEQVILRLREVNHNGCQLCHNCQCSYLNLCDTCKNCTCAEIIQDQLEDIPFNKSIIKQAIKTQHKIIIDLKTPIWTFTECVERVKCQLSYTLPNNYNLRSCAVQTDFNLPFRKSVIKMALFDMYARIPNLER